MRRWAAFLVNGLLIASCGRLDFHPRSTGDQTADVATRGTCDSGLACLDATASQRLDGTLPECDARDTCVVSGIGFEDAATGCHSDGDCPSGEAGAPIDASPSVCPAPLAIETSTEAEPNGTYVYPIGAEAIGCTFTITVDGAGGGRGNHGSRPGSADGGDGGRVIFDFTPASPGVFRVVVGGGGHGEVGNRTMDNPSPGAGGGGASQVSFDPDEATGGSDAIVLAIAGGGGGGGWAEFGADGGGGDSGCGVSVDGGGGCLGVGGAAANGGGPGGSCPSDGAPPDPDPCGGAGGGGSEGKPGGFGVGAGAGSSDSANGSGGGGGGYGGGASGGYQGGGAGGGGSYIARGIVELIGGATGGADNAARYGPELQLIGGSGRVHIEARR